MNALLKPQTAAQSNPTQVLVKATSRAAQLLGLSHDQLGQALGVSRPTVDRMIAGGRGIDPESKEGQLALMLVRVFRSLDALLGDSIPHKDWMQAYTKPLNGKPIELIMTPAGLTHTLDYLDGLRAQA